MYSINRYHSNFYIVCLSCLFIIVSILNTWTTLRRYFLLNNSTNVEYLATVRENQGTRAFYLSILIYLIVGIIFNISYTQFDLKHAQWFRISPFGIILDTEPSSLSSIQLLILIISQGIVIALIDVINKSARGKGSFPDDELSNRDRITRKEWFNFPVGTICSLFRLNKTKKE